MEWATMNGLNSPKLIVVELFEWLDVIYFRKRFSVTLLRNSVLVGRTMDVGRHRLGVLRDTLV